MSLKKKGISRRTFNLTFSASLIGLSLPHKSFSLSPDNMTKDGLVHFTDKGYVNIYSGVGHSSIYSEENPIYIIYKKLELSTDKCRLMYGNNPAQLPALLSQHINHLSFTSKATNEKAVDVLKKYLSEIKGDSSLILSTNRIMLLDDNISKETKRIADQIKGNGIIVAVKEVI